jgi:flagellar basal-body rod protein FlgF
MLKGLYDASAGMKARLAVQDIIASNLANAATDGFQRQVVAIHARMLPPTHITSRVRPLHPGSAQIQALRTDSEDPTMPVATPRELLEPYSTPDSRGGAMQQTGSNADLSLDGPGYLVVQTSGGSRMIRGGSFHPNAQGYLATLSGDPLLGADGRPIQVAGKDWQVSRDGTVSAAGAIAGRLRMVRPTGPVQAEGASLASAARLQDLPAGAAEVRQGYLERSNVDPVKEMVDMIAGVRAYEASQRAVIAQDQSLQSLLDVLRK